MEENEGVFDLSVNSLLNLEIYELTVPSALILQKPLVLA